MKINTITVRVQRLIALAKYENVTYAVEMSASLEDGDEPNEQYEKVLDFCKKKVLAELERIEALKKGS